MTPTSPLSIPEPLDTYVPRVRKPVTEQSSGCAAARQWSLGTRHSGGTRQEETKSTARTGASRRAVTTVIHLP
ncbi:hypothetical protein EWB00_000877 [Schistosoma japonicum]|uniref:Uncharacterized protein n=1 Tax=Schistosoma japonicum TaxID=6182 RepID=A0A4Z2CK46_SCHJA|nr:hypothetical protein EWB00_000877 [Schistosoma japonicum]